METKKFHYDSEGVIDFRPFFDDDSDVASPFVEMTFDQWKSVSARTESQRVAYRNGSVVLEENPDFVKVKTDEERISDLYRWFDDYDMQVRQYERDVRLGMTPDLHIRDKTYATISELDNEAVEKAEELKTLRQSM